MSSTNMVDANGGGNASPPPGRGNGRTNNNRNAGRGGGGRRSNGNGTPRFEGREPSLKGHVYDFTGDRTPDQYIRTTKEIVTYVGRTYTKYTSDFTQAMNTLTLHDPVAPANPAQGDVVAFELWKLDIKDHRDKVKEYSNFRAGLYNLVLGQCTEAMQDRLKSHNDFMAANQDGIALLVIIRSLIHSFEERVKLADGLCGVREDFYGLRQGKNMSLQRYYETFTAMADVMNEVDASPVDSPLTADVAQRNNRNVPIDADREQAKQEALAVRFIRCMELPLHRQPVIYSRRMMIQRTCQVRRRTCLCTW